MFGKVDIKKWTSNPNNPFVLLAPAIIISLGIFYYFASNFNNYSMLVEMKCWINDCLNQTDISTQIAAAIGGFLRFFNIDGSLSSRAFTFVNVNLYTFACGTDLNCQNYFQIFWLCFSAFLIILLLIQMKEHFILSVFAGLFWAFSMPVFDALLWQATLHDKLVTAFILLSLNLSYFFINRHVTKKTILLSNLLVFVSLIFSYNSKEMSFGLAPIILMMILFFGKDKKRNLLLFIAPFSYAIFHLSVRGYYILTGPKDSHVFNAGVFDHIFRYVSFYFNRDNGPYGKEIVLGGLYVLIALSILRYKEVLERQLSFEFKKVLFFLIGWIFILFPALQTQFSPAFYMLAPAVFFIVFGFLLTKHFMTDVILFVSSEVPSGKSQYVWTVGSLLMIIFFKNTIHYQIKQFDDFIIIQKNTGFIKYSENVQKLFTIIRDTIKNHTNEKINFVYDNNHVGFMFLCNGCTYSFIYNQYDQGQKKDSLIDCMNLEKFKKIDRSSLDKNYYLLLSNELLLKEIYQGNQKIY